MTHEIFVDRPIGPRAGELSASEFKTQLRKIPANQPVVLRIDSEGGSVFDGLSIHDAVASHAGRVTAKIQNAFSIASLIAMAADEVEIAANGYWMIHSPAMDTYGTADDLRRSGDLLDSVGERMVQIYASRAKKTAAYIRSKIGRDWFLDARQAVAEGFVDRIIPGAVITASLRTSPLRRYPQLRAAVVAQANRRPTQTQRVVRGNAMARWQLEVQAAKPRCNGDYLRAVRDVEDRYPGLRQLAIDEQRG